MEKDLRALIINAEHSTKFREHVLNDYWILYYSLSRLTAHNNCIYCNMGVQVNTNPLPNQIDIGGEAVALTCERDK